MTFGQGIFDIGANRLIAATNGCHPVLAFVVGTPVGLIVGADPLQQGSVRARPPISC
jgi:hypothetical protein